MRKCDSCLYGEKLYDGTLICQHIVSMLGYENWKDIFGTVDEYSIELVGLCTDICVVSNALALRMFYPSWNISVDESCCAGVTTKKHKAALEVMKSCQIEVTNSQKTK